MGLLFPLPNIFFCPTSPDSRNGLTSSIHYPGDSHQGYLYCLPIIIGSPFLCAEKQSSLNSVFVFFPTNPHHSSYPYSEDSSQGKQYMNTRCPAWCDRILFSASARDLVLKVSLQTWLFSHFIPVLWPFISSALPTFPHTAATPPHRWKNEVPVNSLC